MIKKIKQQNGFTTTDATIAIIIVTFALILISTIVYNTYIQTLSTHKNSMATFYAVEVLEKVQKLDYNDVYLEEGVLDSNVSNEILGIPIDSNYNVKLYIEKYNSSEHNIGKEDIIKILKVEVKYTDDKLVKNIEISTLKLNM